MKKGNIRTTAEEAARLTAQTRKGFSSVQMLCVIKDIRHDHPELGAYLDHPEIIVGLAEGRFGMNGLKRRLAEMLAADTGEGVKL